MSIAIYKQFQSFSSSLNYPKISTKQTKIIQIAKRAGMFNSIRIFIIYIF